MSKSLNMGGNETLNFGVDCFTSKRNIISSASNNNNTIQNLHSSNPVTALSDVQ